MRNLNTPKHRVGVGSHVTGVRAHRQLGSPGLRGECVHDRKGVCHLHGQAIKNFKPGHVMTVGPGGVPKKKYTKKTYWVCDLDLNGMKKLRQPRLSTMMTQNDSGQGGDDNTVSVRDGAVPSTSKEGQN